MGLGRRKYGEGSRDGHTPLETIKVLVIVMHAFITCHKSTDLGQSYIFSLAVCK